MAPKKGQITWFSRWMRGGVSSDLSVENAVALLTFTANLVPDQKAIHALWQRISKLPQMPAAQQAPEAAKLYAKLESTLCPSVFSVDVLRRKIADRFELRLIRMPFVIDLLPVAERGIIRSELKVDETVQALLPAIGRVQVEKFISQRVYGTILEGVRLDDVGHLDFSVAESRFFRLPLPWMALVEKALDQFHGEVKTLLAKSKKVSVPLSEHAVDMLKTLGLGDLSRRGIVRDVEQRLVAKNGALIPVVVTASALRGSDGVTQGAVVSVKDMRAIIRVEMEKQTVTKELLEKVEAEKDKLAGTLESIGDGAFVVDGKGIITFFNPVAERMSGYARSEAIGKPYKSILRFVRESDRSENYLFIEEAMARGSVSFLTNHTLLVSKDGGEISVANSAAPIKTPEGDLAGCIVIFRDVTRERIDQKMKDEFIWLASHQLRTPLAAMRWLSDILISEKIPCLTKPQRVLLSDLNETTVRMTGVVNALLNIARIEGDHLSVHPKPVDVDTLIRSVVQTLRPMIITKKQKVKIDIQRIDTVTTDEQIVSEVVSNLVSNALKYTPSGGTIEIHVKSKKTNVLFEVKDNGYGIPEKQKHLVFQKFFRGENVTRIVTDGNGLGLYIVQRLVGLLGGEIWFESEEKKGTTFSFTIPRRGTRERKRDRELT